MKRVNKKGVSPVIASGFMVLMVMVLASIVFLWARGFIGEQIEKFGEPIENYCSQVDFAVARYDSELEVLNRGNIDIRSLDVKKVRGGDSEFIQFPFQVDAGGSEMKHVTLEMKDGRVPDEIFVYPILVGNVKGENRNNVFTCLDAGVKL